MLVLCVICCTCTGHWCLVVKCPWMSICKEKKKAPSKLPTLQRKGLTKKCAVHLQKLFAWEMFLIQNFSYTFIFRLRVALVYSYDTLLSCNIVTKPRYQAVIFLWPVFTSIRCFPCEWILEIFDKHQSSDEEGPASIFTWLIGFQMNVYSQLVDLRLWMFETWKLSSTSCPDTPSTTCWGQFPLLNTGVSLLIKTLFEQYNELNH